MATIDTLTNSLDKISTRAAAKEFIKTEMGGQFDERSLSIHDNGVNFTLRVESPLHFGAREIRNRKYGSLR